MTGEYEDYALLQQYSKRCTGSDWCTPNDSFLDWEGCTYPVFNTTGGVERTATDVEASTLPQTVSVQNMLENFDYVQYLGLGCLVAETYCYWVLDSGTGVNAIYKLSATKPAQNLLITITNDTVQRSITGPGLLQDQSGTVLTRLPGLYTQAASPRFCCENKAWISSLINLNGAAYIRNICGMQNSLYKNKALRLPITNVGTILDMCNNEMDLGPYLVLYGLFSETGITFYKSLYSPTDYTQLLEKSRQVYDKENTTLLQIQGKKVYDLMENPRCHQLNHINLLKNGISYDPVPSTFVYDPTKK
jgi:hypothetical protein